MKIACQFSLSGNKKKFLSRYFCFRLIKIIPFISFHYSIKYKILTQMIKHKNYNYFFMISRYLSHLNFLPIPFINQISKIILTLHNSPYKCHEWLQVSHRQYRKYCHILSTKKTHWDRLTCNQFHFIAIIKVHEYLEIRETVVKQSYQNRCLIIWNWNTLK